MIMAPAMSEPNEKRIIRAIDDRIGSRIGIFVVVVLGSFHAVKYLIRGRAAACYWLLTKYHSHSSPDPGRRAAAS